jgi:hypothetical protein
MKWISVSIELPPMDVPVWLWTGTDTPSFFIGCRAMNGEEWFWCHCYGSQYWDREKQRWDAGDAEMDDDYKPTHWMALPHPPTK